MVFLVLLDLKEREATLACRDLQDPPHHHRTSREPKETRGYQVKLRTSLVLQRQENDCLPSRLLVFMCVLQVSQVFLVRKASKVSLVTLDNQEEMGAQDLLDHQVWVRPPMLKSTHS